MRPNPHQILAFAQAAREGSFTRAAQRLGVSQSAVTQHVDRLEKSLGSRLFLRSRDGLELTRTGHDLHELADRMLTLDQALADRMEGFAAMERGHLSVIANAPRPALEIIARFKQQHPDVELDFTLFDWTTAMGMLRERRADVAIVTAPDRIGSAVSHRIGGARYVAYLPKDHAWAKRPAISLSEMVTEVLLLPEEGSFTQKVVRRKLAAFDLMPKRQLRITTFPLMQEAVLHHLGIGIFLENSSHPSTAICGIPITEMPEIYDTCVVIPEDKTRLALVERFLALAL